MQVFKNNHVCKIDLTCFYIYFILKENSYMIQFVSKPNQFISLNMNMVPQIENPTHKLHIGKSIYMIFLVQPKSSVTYVNILPIKALFWNVF